MEDMCVAEARWARDMCSAGGDDGKGLCSAVKLQGARVDLAGLCAKKSESGGGRVWTFCEDPLLKDALTRWQEGREEGCGVNALNGIVERQCAGCSDGVWECAHPEGRPGFACQPAWGLGDASVFPRHASSTTFYGTQADCERECLSRNHRGKDSGKAAHSLEPERLLRREVSCVNKKGSTPGWVHLGWAGPGGRADESAECGDSLGVSDIVDIS